MSAVHDSISELTLIDPIKPPSALVTIKQATLATVAQYEVALRELAERFRDVVFDVSTTDGLVAARAARHELREKGRYAVQRARDDAKKQLNDGKKDLETEADRLIAIVQPTEDAIDKQVTKREDELERIEAARKEKHLTAIDLIRSYVGMAKGLPASRIAMGVDAMQKILDGFDSDSWEEYSERAVNAMRETLATLQAMHAAAVENEARAVREAALKADNERLQRELAAARAAAAPPPATATPAPAYRAQPPDAPRHEAPAEAAQVGGQTSVKGGHAEERPALEATLEAMTAEGCKRFVGRIEMIEPREPRFDNKDAATVDGELVITTGAIGKRCGVPIPYVMLHNLGIKHHSAIKGNAGFYWRVSDWPLICGALSNHFSDLAQR